MMSFYSKFAAYYEDIFPFSQNAADFLSTHFITLHHCLDVGCGTGHYASYLSTQGLRVTGIDLDAAMIRFAQQHYPGVHFKCMDMRSITALQERFAYIYCIGNSGAHLLRQDFDHFIFDVHSMMLPSGTWILQLMNWDFVLKRDSVQFPLIETVDNLSFHRKYTQISEDSVQFETSLQVGKTVVFSDRVPLYPVLSEDIIELHANAGFQLKDHFSSYNRASFDPEVFSANIFVFTTRD